MVTWLLECTQVEKGICILLRIICILYVSRRDNNGNKPKHHLEYIWFSTNIWYLLRLQNCIQIQCVKVYKIYNYVRQDVMSLFSALVTKFLEELRCFNWNIRIPLVGEPAFPRSTMTKMAFANVVIQAVKAAKG